MRTETRVMSFAVALLLFAALVLARPTSTTTAGVLHIARSILLLHHFQWSGSNQLFLRH